jgi:hypothetical protein
LNWKAVSEEKSISKPKVQIRRNLPRKSRLVGGGLPIYKFDIPLSVACLLQAGILAFEVVLRRKDV